MFIEEVTIAYWRNAFVNFPTTIYTQDGRPHPNHVPFLFPSYRAVDAVEAGDPGKRLFTLIEQKGVVPLAWGENGFRELTNAKRPIRRPADLQGPESPRRRHTHLRRDLPGPRRNPG